MENERPFESESETEPRPFGVEYLEPLEFEAQVEVRGAQDDICCVTISDYSEGQFFCSEGDSCV